MPRARRVGSSRRRGLPLRHVARPSGMRHRDVRRRTVRPRRALRHRLRLAAGTMAQAHRPGCAGAPTPAPRRRRRVGPHARRGDAMTRRRPKLGQHFLRDVRYAERAVEAAQLTKADIVLEVGPGHGVLTKLLVAAGVTKVVAIELDEALADALDVPGVELIRGDAAQVAWP